MILLFRVWASHFLAANLFKFSIYYIILHSLSKIPEDVIEEDGVECEDIGCSVCSADATDDNDVVMCDGKGCFCAFHQMCLDPPLLEIPEGDGDWLCHKCGK